MKHLLFCAGVALLAIGTALTASAQTSRFDIVASGLDGPRGLKFGPGGNLYVAEAGVGGSRTTVGQCTRACR
jgi:3-deoxy-D-arabino-heptulosonate 7-phosphate (DAHP) synthase